MPPQARWAMFVKKEGISNSSHRAQRPNALICTNNRVSDDSVKSAQKCAKHTCLLSAQVRFVYFLVLFLEWRNPDSSCVDQCFWYLGSVARIDIHNLPKGPFRTKTSTALESIVIRYRRSFSPSVPFSCLFCLEKQGISEPSPLRFAASVSNLLPVPKFTLHSIFSTGGSLGLVERCFQDSLPQTNRGKTPHVRNFVCQ